MSRFWNRNWKNIVKFANLFLQKSWQPPTFLHLPPPMYVLAAVCNNIFLMLFEYAQYKVIFLSVEDESFHLGRQNIYEDYGYNSGAPFLDWHSAWMCIRYSFSNLPWGVDYICQSQYYYLHLCDLPSFAISLLF